MALVEYEAVVTAICKAAARMRKRDHDTVFACLWAAGVHPSGFNPTYRDPFTDALGTGERSEQREVSRKARSRREAPND